MKSCEYKNKKAKIYDLNENDFPSNIHSITKCGRNYRNGTIILTNSFLHSHSLRVDHMKLTYEDKDFLKNEIKKGVPIKVIHKSLQDIRENDPKEKISKLYYSDLNYLRYLSA